MQDNEELKVYIANSGKTLIETVLELLGVSDDERQEIGRASCRERV